jgi:class 3 adenylate cyclase/ligand-binding sensor domain-containing protein/CheY-like chemotaxis protein
MFGLTHRAVRALLGTCMALPGAAAAQFAPDTLALPFRAITINDGLSQGMVQAMAQDPYGFLWFGTKDGLNRYDGYGFTVFRHDLEDSTSLRENSVTNLYVDLQGRLWVGTARGLELLNRATERFTHVRFPGEAELGAVRGMRMDRHGDLWVAGSGGLVKLSFAQAVREGEPLPPFTVRWIGDGMSAVSATRDGRIWCSFSGFSACIAPVHQGRDHLDTVRVARPDGARRHLKQLRVLEDTVGGRLYGIHDDGVVALSADGMRCTELYHVDPGKGWINSDGPLLVADGSIWLPTYGGLYRFEPATRRLSLIRAIDTGLSQGFSTLCSGVIERAGTIWLGSTGYGLFRYDPRIERFHNLPDRSVRSLAPGLNDRILVSHYGRLLGILDAKTLSYARMVEQLTDLGPGLDTLSLGANAMTVQDDDGVLWIALAYGSLVRYDPQQRRATALPMGQGERGVLFPLLLGRGGYLWCGGDTGLWRVDRSTMRPTLFRWPIPSTRNPYDFVTALVETPDGAIWAGTMSGVLRLDPAKGRWRHYAHRPGDPRTLSSNTVFSLCPDSGDPSGTLWVGTSGGGLNRLDARSGEARRITTREGLPNDVIYGVLSDEDGRLWMSTNKGIARLDPRSGAIRTFNVGDGLQSDEFNRYAYCKDAHGRLWFGGVSGINWFHPRELREDSTPVTVRITGVELMNKPVRFGEAGSPLARPAYLSAGMTIPYSMNMVSFSFASMEFSSPELHQYRYKLDGFDPEWIEAGTTRKAIYTNLDPGRYTFRVRGRNRDGVWDEQGTAFALTVLPPWWRTWWFFTLCAVVVVGGTLLYIRSLRRQKEHLERTVAERTRELSREKDRSEELLKNILPENVATELKARGHAEARHFEQVTVLFSDFKDFTRISEQLTAADLVDELNVCFNAFDRIMEKYGVEKIKTIGDAYMAAGGVPDPSGGMPLAVVLAGLEMQQIMRERQAEREAQGKPAFRMRVGIHTGPVVAGIVGRRKFAYDIWGDTVNIASRMESSCEPGEVNISAATHELVKDEKDLLFTPRGKVSAKGKGELEMCYVRARSIEDVVRAEPLKPEPMPTETVEGAQMDALRTAVNGQPSTALRELRILLAEDNEFNAMVVQGHLENWVPGARITHVLNGAEAVAAMRHDRFDLVLMDIQMPEMNGYDAARAIRALPDAKGRVPIIAMSANVMKAEIDRCMEAGMNAFVPKPYKREQLLEAMEKVVVQ